MPLITSVPEPNLWEQICKEFAAERPPFPEPRIKSAGDGSSIATELIEFDPAKHSPIFYGRLARKELNVDDEGGFDPSVSHPAAIGHCFLERPPSKDPTPPPSPPDKKTCSPRDYLQHYIFPILTPALEHMLQRAKEEKCFQRRRTAFNALDCLTEYLYANNPRHSDRQGTVLADIPFVRAWWAEHPRAPLPKSLLWSDAEAALIIQSHLRGFRVRREPEIQELRQWQREWREMNRDARERVNEFWEKRMPSEDALAPPEASEETEKAEAKEEPRQEAEEEPGPLGEEASETAVPAEP